MLRDPALGLAEIAWRWTFAAAAVLLCVLAFVAYLRTLPVSRADQVLLVTGQPALIIQALKHIFKGSAGRVIDAAMVLTIALTAIWIVVASLARAATIKAVVAYFRERQATATEENAEEKNTWRLRSLLLLNLFRVAATPAALIACAAAVLLSAASTPVHARSPRSGLLVFLTVAILVWFTWSTLNWLLSLAALFVVRDGRDALGAILETVVLCAVKTGSVLAVGTWFSLAHLAAFVAATCIAAFLLFLAAVVPPGVIVLYLFFLALFYFAVVDFLYIGRLAAYLAILESPAVLSAPIQLTANAAVDPEELILSDLPSAWKLAAEPEV